MKSPKNYIEQHKQRFIDELISLLKIPSVSAEPHYKKEVLLTAQREIHD